MPIGRPQPRPHCVRSAARLVAHSPAGACRQRKAIALAICLAAKMAVPMRFKMQKGYYFHYQHRTRLQIMNSG